MTTCSEDIKDMLVDTSALGLIYATNLFVGNEPARPYNTVTIFDSYGFSAKIAMDKTVWERPAVQIRIRNTSYLEGMSLANSIVDSLHGRAQETWNGTLYSLIQLASGPALLDWEDNKARIVINFNILRR